MTSDEKMHILGCFHRWVMKDPYPEISRWEYNESMKAPMEKLWGRVIPSAPKPEVSAHKAWMDGYEFAKKLVEGAVDTLPVHTSLHAYVDTTPCRTVNLPVEMTKEEFAAAVRREMNEGIKKMWADLNKEPDPNV